MASPATTVLASANTSWYLYNFKLGLLRRLRDVGCKIVLAAPRDEYSDRLTDWGFDFRALEIDSKGTNPLRDLRLLLNYVRLIRDSSAGLVLSFTVKPVVYGSLAARLTGIPTLPTITGMGSSFIRGGLVMQIVRVLYRAALSHASQVFFQNSDDLELFRAHSVVRRSHACTLVAGSGVDPNHFAPRPRVQDGRFTFLVATRMLRDKGVGEYVQAAGQLRHRFPRSRFLLLGKCDVDNPSAISRSQIDEWHAKGDIEYLGETDDVRPLIAASDVVVLPSYREGKPRILLEAASMARPIVTTDVTGCRDVVAHGINGYLCKARDATDLAAALEKMLRLPGADREQMGVRGRQRIIQDFNEQGVVAAYVQAVGQATATKPRRSSKK
jgi:glycosyltransferase involved in cell wall biosynthesis